MTPTNKTIAERPYFYHSNHLGSSAWITNNAGTPVQSITYLPYGKEFINQTLNGFDAVYKFLGCEYDSETGYTKTDFRYFDNQLGIFISPDPLSTARPWITPYNYSQNNPINRSDRTGLLDDGYQDGAGNYQWFDNHTESSFTKENTTWTKVTDNKKAWNEATTIRNAVVKGLVQLGNNETDVKKDVGLFSGDNPLFTKEAKINNADKYTSGWKDEYNSETNTWEALQSPTMSGFALKFYPTKGGMKNANAMGLVNANSFGHLFEGGMEYIEKKIFGSGAVNDPIYDMHYNNARDFLYGRPEPAKIGVPVYYQGGHK